MDLIAKTKIPGFKLSQPETWDFKFACPPMRGVELFCV